MSESIWPEGQATTELLVDVREGKPQAVEELFDRHRDPLRRMIAMRLDQRLAQRVDVSDIIQDVLIEANRRLVEYVQSPSIPFHLWIRQIAKDRIIDAHRRHRLSAKRSIDREQGPIAFASNDQSTIDQRFSTPIPSPIPSPSPTPIYTDRLDGNTPRARETPTDSRTYRQQQRGLTARPAVRTLDSELDRPEPRRYESATEARIRRALELDERINGEADRKELESIAEYFTQEKK